MRRIIIISIISIIATLFVWWMVLVYVMEPAVFWDLFTKALVGFLIGGIITNLLGK